MNSLFLIVLLLGQCSGGNCSSTRIEPNRAVAWQNTIRTPAGQNILKSVNSNEIKIINGRLVLPKDAREELYRLMQKQKVKGK